MDASETGYATPPVNEERLRETIKEMELFFLDKLREVYGAEKIDGIVRDDGSLDEDKLNALDSTADETNAIGLMLRTMGISEEGLHSVLRTVVQSTLHMAAAHPEREIHEHLMDEALTLFQLGWVAREKLDAWAAEDAADSVRW